MIFMSRTSALVIAGAALGTLLSFSAWALPISAPSSNSASNIILAAEGCGRGEHREHGRCEPDRPHHRICPPGFHFSDRADRCVRN
ncbi:MAG TPA: hypothetical protein VGG01_14785 [Xanthobacteraceae bacterium]